MILHTIIDMNDVLCTTHTMLKSKNYKNTNNNDVFLEIQANKIKRLHSTNLKDYLNQSSYTVRHGTKRR